MKVYLAARYSTKDQIAKYAEELRALGIEVTSTWLEEPHSPTSQLNELEGEQHTFYALNDLRDVDAADALVFFSVPPTQPMVRGGRHVEFGYALGKRLPIVVVGPKENIFHYLPSVRHVDTWGDAVNLLTEALDV